MFKKYFKTNRKAENKSNDHDQTIFENENFCSISETDSNDIFIAGYPKSGNTWVQNLVAGVLYGIDASLLPDKLTQEIVPDVHGKTFYKRFGPITFFKSHHLPTPAMKRVIHLVRDGRDVMSSYYAMNKALKLNVSLEEMILDGKALFPGKWHEHTREWLRNPCNADITILKYEDLIDDPFQAFKKVLDHFGIERSDEVISRSVQGNSFIEMQRKEKDYGWYNSNWDKNEKFIRKGKVGSYKDEIPDKLIAFFENEANEELKALNYIT